MQTLGLSGASAETAATPLERLDGPEPQTISVEYDPRVLDEIRAYVGNELDHIGPSAFETGGVLFGTHAQGRVTVTAMRPAACAYSSGPVFVLSPADHRNLQEVVSLHQTDPELRGLEPVGWFLSHARDSLVLRPSDREIFDRHFGQTWHVVLVIRPGRTGSLRAATMAHGTEDDVLLNDFTIRQAKDRQSPSAVRPSVRPSVRPAVAASVPVRFASPIEAFMRRPARMPAQLSAALSLSAVELKRKWQPLAAASAVLVIAAITIAVYLRARSTDSIALEAMDRAGIMYIEWNPESRTIGRATRGELEIFDGDQRTARNLSKADLKRGMFVIVRKKPDVTARLRLFDKGSMIHQELTRYAGWPVIREDTSEAKLQSLENENFDLRTELTKERQRADDLERRVEKLERKPPNRRRR